MKPFALIVFFALIVPPSISAEGDVGDRPTLFFSATLDLANAFSRGDAPDINRLRRGEGPFDNLRLTLFGDVVFGPTLVLFNQITIDPASRASLPSYLRSHIRFTLFRSERADLQIEAGKLPTTFGTFGPRAYSDRNPLVGAPLIYHYFSSLRANQLPADNADLLEHRGEGRADAFGGYAGVGSDGRTSGLPIVYDACWDTGVRAVGSLWRLEYAVGITQGTLSDPQSKTGDNNDGKQIVGRVGIVPMAGLVIGASFARGPYLDDAVAGPLAEQGIDAGDFHQEAVGLDLDYGVRHLRLIGEFASNRWEAPSITDGRGNPADLKNVGWYAEGRYAIRPGLYAAVRYGQITFGKIDDGAGGHAAWDDPVRRWEWGLGYYFLDGVIGKVVRQDIRRGPAGTPYASFWAAQISMSF